MAESAQTPTHQPHPSNGDPNPTLPPELQRDLPPRGSLARIRNEQIRRWLKGDLGEGLTDR